MLWWRETACKPRFVSKRMACKRRNADEDGMAWDGMGFAHDHSVSPGEDGKFIEAGNEVPSGGDVASYEYAKS